MKQINDILKDIDTNIDNNKYLKIDNNRYSFKENYKLLNEKSTTAKTIAEELDDLDNFAFYLSVVGRIGSPKALEILSETKSDVKIGDEQGRPIRNPAALFNWKTKTWIGRGNNGEK